MTDQLVRDAIALVDPDAMFADGYDDCIIGTTRIWNVGHVVVYSIDLIIRKLIEEGASEGDAWEHFFFNIEGAYVGSHTPLYVMNYDCTGVENE